MKTHRWLLATLLFFTPLLQAGTPDHLMWTGHEQDALILGEVVGKPSALSNTVRIMAVFPQTTALWRDTLKVGQVIRFDGGNLPLSSKYLMSLVLETSLYGRLSGNPEVMLKLEKRREAEGRYKGTPQWGIYELTPDSTGFADTRILEKGFLRNDLQLMVSSGGKYLSPADAFPEPPEAVENPQIPADLLKQIPTRELIEIWLEYPHLHLVHSSKTLQGGMDKLRTTFNGLPELLQRDDVADVLFGIFREKNLDNLTIKPDSDADKQLANQHAALALLLAQPEIQERLPFYQRWYLHWQVAERQEAMAETWLGSEPAFICYRALEAVLDQ